MTSTNVKATRVRMEPRVPTVLMSTRASAKQGTLGKTARRRSMSAKCTSLVRTRRDVWVS